MTKDLALLVGDTAGLADHRGLPRQGRREPREGAGRAGGLIGLRALNKGRPERAGMMREGGGGMTPPPDLPADPDRRGRRGGQLRRRALVRLPGAARRGVDLSDTQALGKLIDYAAVRQGSGPSSRRARTSRRRPSTSSTTRSGPCSRPSSRRPVAPREEVNAWLTPARARRAVRRPACPACGARARAAALADGRVLGPDRCRIEVADPRTKKRPVNFTFERRGIFTWKLVRITPPDPQVGGSGRGEAPPGILRAGRPAVRRRLLRLARLCALPAQGGGEQHDRDKLEALIDFPAVSENLKPPGRQRVIKAARVAEEAAGCRWRRSAGSARSGATAKSAS